MDRRVEARARRVLATSSSSSGGDAEPVNHAPDARVPRASHILSMGPRAHELQREGIT